MTNPTPHGQVPEALRLADEISKAGTFPAYPRAPYEAAAAELRRLHAQVAALTAAPQGVAYAEMPESLMLEVDRWFADNTGLGGCSDKDVRELAQLFYEVAHEGGRESVDDALAIVESFGPGISGLNDTYARQVLLAEEVKRLRAPHGQAPAGATQEPTAVVAPCHTPSGKRVALYSAKQDLPIGTKLYTAPKPSPTEQAAESVTAPAATPTAASIAWTALRDLTDPLGEAGVKIMGHVRIYAQRQYEAGLTEGRATPPAPAADSVLEDAARLDWLALAGPVSICLVIDRPHDGEVEVATDDVTGYGKTLREALDAARAPADSVREDAARYRWLFGARTDAQTMSVSETVFKPLPQDEVLSHLQGFYMSKTVVDELVDAARKQGANHD